MKHSRLLFTLLAALAVVFPVLRSARAGIDYQDLAAFAVGPNGLSPGALVLASNGYFYGVATNGGNDSAGDGVIYRVKKDGSRYEMVVSFDGDTGGPVAGAAPYGRVLDDGHGFLWGTTSTSGANEQGTIYKLEVATGKLTTMADLPAQDPNLPAGSGIGPQAGLAKDANGIFGGTTYGGTASGNAGLGVVFKFDPATGTLTTTSSFTADASAASGNCTSPLIYAAGFLWGTTNNGGTSGAGTVFKIDPSTGTLTGVVDFGTDTDADAPQNPAGELIFASDGQLWGLAGGGGSDGYGVVYAVNSSTGAVTTKASFNGSGGNNADCGYQPMLVGLTAEANGDLYGTTSFAPDDATGLNAGAVFKVSVPSGTLSFVVAWQDQLGTTEASTPVSTLASDGAGHLFGACLNGGSIGTGAVFEVNESSGVATVAANLTDGQSDPRGNNPVGPLVPDGQGKLWGVTHDGGTGGVGTIFTFDPSTMITTTVVDFIYSGTGALGDNPNGGLVADGQGYLWGTTFSGGAFGGTPLGNHGNIYKVKISDGTYAEQAKFTGDNGTNPSGELVKDQNGYLWGITRVDGAGGQGTVFRISSTAANPTIETVVSFGTSNGTPNARGNPRDTLWFDGAHTVWGLTTDPTSNMGSVFTVDTSTEVFTRVATFADPTFYVSYGGLVDDGQGNLWGNTGLGGANNVGAVFKINRTTYDVEFVASFDTDSTGIEPQAGMTDDGAGHLFGVSSGTPSSNYSGEVFEVDETSGALTTLFNFGTTVSGQLVDQFSPNTGKFYVDADGYYYGNSQGGGAFGSGGLYRFKPTPVTDPATIITPANNGYGKNPLVVKFNLPDNALAGSVQLKFDGTSPVTLVLASGEESAGTHTISIDTTAPNSDSTQVASSTGTFADGSYSATLTYQDTSGDTSATSTAVAFTLDTVAPVITPPTNGFTSLLFYAGGTVPNYASQVMTTDATNVTTSQEITSGSADTPGPATVTITATDAAGNASTYDAQVTVRPTAAASTIVLSASTSAKIAGEAVPGHGTFTGIADDAKLASLGPPAIAPDGTVAFLAKWTSVTGPIKRGSGIFTDAGPVAIVGGAAPGGGTYKTLSDPVVSSGGVAFLATLSGVTKGQEQVVVSNAPTGALAIVAQSSTDSGAGDGSTFKSFKELQVVGNVVGFLGQLNTGSGSPKVTASDALGLWEQDGSGSPTLLLRQGDAVGTAKIKTLVTFSTGSGSPGQGRGWVTDPYGVEMLALALLNDTAKTQVVLSANKNGPPTIISQSLSTTAGPPALAGASFQSYGFPATNDNLNFAFLGKLTPGTPTTVTKANAQGIFLAPQNFTPATFTPVVRLLDPAPGTGTTAGAFSVLKDPVLGADGGLAFWATVKGGTVKAASATTLWWQPPGQALALLAQAGPRAGIGVPGVSTDAEWKTFPSLAIAGSRGPLFTATLATGKGGVTAKTATGAWAVDFTGAIQPLFQTNGQIPVGGKTLKSFLFLQAVPDSMGVSRAFNDNGQVVWLATFTDGTTAIVKTQVP